MQFEWTSGTKTLLDLRVRKQLGLVICEKFIRFAKNATRIWHERVTSYNKKLVKLSHYWGYGLLISRENLVTIPEIKPGVLLIERQSHRPEVTDGGLIDHFLWSRAFETLHRVLDRLLAFHQILHLGCEYELQTTGITKPAGSPICI